MINQSQAGVRAEAAWGKGSRAGGEFAQQFAAQAETRQYLERRIGLYSDKNLFLQD